MYFAQVPRLDAATDWKTDPQPSCFILPSLACLYCSWGAKFTGAHGTESLKYSIQGRHSGHNSGSQRGPASLMWSNEEAWMKCKAITRGDHAPELKQGQELLL